MASLEDIILYFCDHYPHKSELSKARITKMVYLADWKSALDNEKQISSIGWHFNHFGPYVDDVVEEARRSRKLDVIQTNNIYGNLKELVAASAGSSSAQISQEEEDVLDHVIKTTKDKYWSGFIKLVYSTYPILVTPKYNSLNLEDLAKKYKEKKGVLIPGE